VADCAGKCPHCLDPDIEPFVVWSYDSPIPNERRMMHCVRNGHVFEEHAT